MKTPHLLQATKFLCLAFVTTLLLTSCDKHLRKNGSGVITSVTRDVSEFTELEIDGRFDVYIHIDENPRVAITTDDNMISEVQTFVQDGGLQIEMNDDYYRYKFTKMEVHVYNSTYTKLDLDGNIKAYVEDTIYSSSLELKHEGSGNTSLKFSGDNLSMHINGTGNIQASGVAPDSKVHINGWGKVDALDLSAQNVQASIQGSGKIYVHCSDHLNASINGSGIIRYIGSPSVNSSINGSGSIAPY